MPPAAAARRADADVVLTYHSISAGGGILCTAPERLGDDLDWIVGCGYHPVALGEIADGVRGGEPWPGPRVAVTFDDGYRDFLDAALPVLEARRIPATVFVTAAADRSRLPQGVDAPLLPLSALAGLADRGVTVGSHAVGHVDLLTLDDAALDRELGDSRRILEAAAERSVDLFAYPFGAVDMRIRNAAARHYRAACTTHLGRVFAGADPLAIPRLDAFYLRSAVLRVLLARRRPDLYLSARHRLRRLRGSERSAL